VNRGGTEIVDLVFGLRGRAIALDYADRLWRELSTRLPWLAHDEAAGVHPLAGVSPGDTEMYLTRRARMSLRLAREACAAAQALTGSRFDLGGEVEVLDAPTLRMLQPSKVLYSSFVAVGETDEGRFVATCREQIAAMGITGELIVGRAQRASDSERTWRGYSLMVHDLKPEHSLQLQRVGLGNERQRGCGIFVPHKALAAVNE
jgi:CRISPR-associated protein Cas6